MPAKDFLLPDLGEGLEDAEVVVWRVSEGERIELNQTLVEVNTAKALVEIPAPWEGVVETLHAAEGDVVKVGQPLVSIRVEEGQPTEPLAPPELSSDEASPEAAAGAAQQAAQEVGAPAVEQAAQDAQDAQERAGEHVTDETTQQGPKRRPVLVGYGVAEEEELRPARRREAAYSEAEPPRRHGPVPASPPVRRLAKELGVDLASVTGSGPGGRVTRDDVEKAARRREGPLVSESEGPGGVKLWAVAVEDDVQVVPVRGTRRLIAEQMARSVREIPHVTTFLTMDASAIQGFREHISSAKGERVSPLPIVVRALAEVCREYPELNSSFQAELSEIHLYRDCHVGIAMETERGLLVPVVPDAARKGILEISREITALSEGARAGRLAPDQMMGGTVTVTNVGTFGAEFGTPVINHPEAAILALGVIEPRALVVEGRVEARPAVTLSLSFDHRVLDGARAGRALAALRALLESPFRLGALPT